jgi:hypothetical protein
MSLSSIVRETWNGAVAGFGIALDPIGYGFNRLDYGLTGIGVDDYIDTVAGNFVRQAYEPERPIGFGGYVARGIGNVVGSVGGIAALSIPAAVVYAVAPALALPTLVAFPIATGIYGTYKFLQKYYQQSNAPWGDFKSGFLYGLERGLDYYGTAINMFLHGLDGKSLERSPWRSPASMRANKVSRNLKSVAGSAIGHVAGGMAGAILTPIAYGVQFLRGIYNTATRRHISFSRG